MKLASELSYPQQILNQAVQKVSQSSTQSCALYMAVERGAS